MYNYSFETTYQNLDDVSGDTKYREELLKALLLEKYDDKKMEEIREIVMEETSNFLKLDKD